MSALAQPLLQQTTLTQNLLAQVQSTPSNQTPEIKGKNDPCVKIL